MRVSWDVVFGKPAREFLNVLSYRRDRDARDQDATTRWQNTH